MFRFRPLVLAFALTGLAVTPQLADARTTAQRRPTAYRVQVRFPWWRVSPAPSVNSAKATAAVLRSQGWSAGVKTVRGRVFVRCRMPRWKTRAVVANPYLARALMAQHQSLGFQSRVVPIH